MSIHHLQYATAVLIALLSLVTEVPNVQARRNSVTIAGTSWSSDGIFRIQGHGGATQLPNRADVFFGPQTANTAAGSVFLTSAEVVLVLTDEINQTVIFGTYSFSRKGRLTISIQSAPESLKQKVIALLETAYDSEYSGIADITSLQLIMALSTRKKQPTGQITFKGNALLSGQLDGDAVDLDLAFSSSSGGQSDVVGVQNLGCGGAEYPIQSTSTYVLPYQPGTTLLMVQGNCTRRGFHSERGGNTYAYDFLMPKGTTIIAARSGVVIKAMAAKDAGGNFVAIRHGDRSVAWYMHISSWLVTEGQSVSQGQAIALSGDSGTTGGIPGPHLHFDVTSCTVPSVHCGVTIPITFRNTIFHPFGLQEELAYTALHD